MPAIDWYSPVRSTHLVLVLASVTLFALRGAAVLAGRRWPLHLALRVGSVVIDTLLLTAGATLWWMLGLHPLREHWLGVKLGWLVAYVVLGSLALQRARTPAGRALAYGAALACAAMMVATAVAHHPAGPFAPGFAATLADRLAR